MPQFTAALILGMFVLLFLIERSIPLRKTKSSLLVRSFVNLSVAGLSFCIAMFIVMPSTLAAVHWTNEKHFGLLPIIDMPLMAQFVVGFLLLDVTFFYWHVANHKIPFFWRFHNVHHIDPDLDVTTAFRFHFGEVFFSTFFRVIQVSIIGCSFEIVALYEIVFQLGTLFQHSNIRLPINIERLLNKIIVTPRMHGIHHSQVTKETNSNFSIVFSFWDTLHRSLGLNIPQSQIEIGIPGYSDADNRLGNVLILPFRKERMYQEKERDMALLPNDRTFLAE